MGFIWGGFLKLLLWVFLVFLKQMSVVVPNSVFFCVPEISTTMCFLTLVDFFWFLPSAYHPVACILSAWLVVWNIYFIFIHIYILNISNHPNWRTHVFSEGWRETTKQMLGMLWAPARSQCDGNAKSRPKLVGGLEHQFYFPIYWVANHPNWLIFFRGVA